MPEPGRVYAWELAHEGLGTDHRYVLVEFSDGGMNCGPDGKRFRLQHWCVRFQRLASWPWRRCRGSGLAAGLDAHRATRRSRQPASQSGPGRLIASPRASLGRAMTEARLWRCPRYQAALASPHRRHNPVYHGLPATTCETDETRNTFAGAPPAPPLQRFGLTWFLRRSLFAVFPAPRAVP